jgi:hypothetical protein
MLAEHRRSEELASQASQASADGQLDEARRLYAEAAEWEERALDQVRSDQARTRSVLSVSLASLYYKAQLFDESEIVIFRQLASRLLLPWAEKELRELLEVVADERLVMEKLGLRYSGQSFTVSLRGGEIGSGTGPLELILEKASGFKNLLYRFAEWVGEYPLRITGNPPKELTALIQARATEPAIGSYRLELRLTEPAQPDLFAGTKIPPEQVADTMFAFLSCLNRGAPREIEELVPQTDYREALLKLTRNVAPTGKRVAEIGVYRHKNGGVQSVYLTNALYEKIREALPPKEAPEVPIQEVRGVLRALHLDQNWLELTRADGTHQKCDTVPSMLDDVVGPMVNQHVEVRGPLRKSRAGVARLLVEDIEQVEEE